MYIRHADGDHGASVWSKWERIATEVDLGKKFDKTGGVINGEIIVNKKIFVKRQNSVVSDVIYNTDKALIFKNGVGNSWYFFMDDGSLEFPATNLETQAKDIVGGINEIANNKISKSKNGYCRLYNGAIMQWGEFNLSEGINVLKFPVSFTGFSSYGFSAILKNSGTGSNLNLLYKSKANSGVELFAKDGSNNPISGEVNWIAIGY